MRGRFRTIASTRAFICTRSTRHNVTVRIVTLLTVPTFGASDGECLVWAVAGAVAERSDAVRIFLFVQHKFVRELEDSSRGRLLRTFAPHA